MKKTVVMFLLRLSRAVIIHLGNILPSCQARDISVRSRQMKKNASMTVGQ